MLLGVNSNNDPKKLKEIMQEKELNWRSFGDQGVIASEWNSPGTPTYYVLDHKGMIRAKWHGHPGEKAVDSAVEAMIHEAEKTEKKMPK